MTDWIQTPWIKFLVDWIVVPALTPFTVGLQESGDRVLFYLTSKRLPSLEGKKDPEKADGVDLVEGVKVAEKGEGAYLLTSNGEESVGKVMYEYRKDGTREKVWEHALATFEEALKKTV